jgi:hypothetical protein
MRRTGIGAGAGGYIPLIGHGDRLREVQCYSPAAEGGSTAVGYTHVHLEERTSRIGRRGGTRVRGECLIAQQQARQQHS